VPRKVFQDFANTLPQMLVGWRMGDDLGTLADLPNGTLSIDILAGTASHSAALQLTLHVAKEMQAWLESRMTTFGIPSQELDAAVLVADIRTDRIATDRKRIVAFDFDCKSTLTSGPRRYVGALAEKHVWHRRTGI
jgi:hypothetical protein